MMTARLQFATGPVPVNWPARVAAYLAALPPDDNWPPHKDFALMEAVHAGAFLAFPERYSADRLAAARRRVWVLMTAIRDDNARPTLDGRAALMVELRSRAE